MKHTESGLKQNLWCDSIGSRTVNCCTRFRKTLADGYCAVSDVRS